MGRLGALMIIAGIICLAVHGITEVTVAIAYGVILLVSGIADIVIFAVWGAADVRRRMAAARRYTHDFAVAVFVV